MVSVERLYELYNTISNAKADAAKHEAEFEEILGGVKGDEGARRMTAQFISRYFATFPNSEEKALNALFDLCEDDDSAIRRQSITSLGVVCRGKAALVPKVADILAQLLQIDDAAELNCVNSALVSLLRIHAKGALTGLFYQLDNNRDDIIRDRVLRFLHTKVQTLQGDVFTKDVQIFVFTEAKKFIPCASPEELGLLLSVLSELSVCRTVTGQQQISELVVARLPLDKPLTDATEAAGVVAILTQAKKFFSNQVKSTKVVDYLLTHCVGHLDTLESSVLVAGQDPSALTLQLLRALAQLFAFSDKLEKPKEAMTLVFKALVDVLPTPPAAGEAGWESDGGASLQFSRVECLLFSLNHLMKQLTEDFFADVNVLKDFRLKLQYFARGSQAYQKVLREAIQGKKGEELKTEENKIKLVALKTTANINTLIKDYFHSPPAAKSTITLSWLLEDKQDKSSAPASVKRRVPVIFDEKLPAAKQQKGAPRQIYAPPGGKFSRGASYSGRGGSRGGNRGRGGRGFRRF